MSRTIPDIRTDVTDGYAHLLARNFDSVQESFNFSIPEALAERLTFHKDLAAERETPIEFSFGGEGFQIWMGASQGKKWVIENDDFQIHFGSPKQQWPITVRYLAAGLWEYGFPALKKRVLDALFKEGLVICSEADVNRIETWCRVSRVDFAFDFYSPAFSLEMISCRVREKLLAPSGVKIGAIGTSRRDETIQIGFSRPGLCIQVYDKGQEITDMSGKTWMFKVWEREGYHPPDDKKARDVWRVEIRFGKEFIKNRGLLTMDQFQEKLQELLAEAIFTRRMISDTGDTHRERCPLHPLWAAVYEETAMVAEYAPIGRQITLRMDAMIDCLEKQITGTARALATIGGEYDDQMARHKMEICTDAITQDKEHLPKVAKVKERYRFIEEAR
jgi:hypothetical protein